MIRTITIGILRQILLVVVGAEAFSSTEITTLSCRGRAVGRHSVDLDVDPAVDHVTVRLKQCLSLLRIVRRRESISLGVLPGFVIAVSHYALELRNKFAFLVVGEPNFPSLNILW